MATGPVPAASARDGRGECLGSVSMTVGHAVRRLHQCDRLGRLRVVTVSDLTTRLADTPDSRRRDPGSARSDGGRSVSG